MSRHDEDPSLSYAADAVNERGGLDMHFAPHGQHGELWVSHFSKVVPYGSALLSEGIPVTTDDLSSLYHTDDSQLDDHLRHRKSIVLPGGYDGDVNSQSGASFAKGELASHMRVMLKLPTHENYQRYVEMQSIREMRAAVGSLAWLGACLTSDLPDLAGRPATLWGRQHSSSLPDMYERLSVRPVDITVHGGEDALLLPPHARTWTDEDIQDAYGRALQHATRYMNTKRKSGNERS